MSILLRDLARLGSGVTTSPSTARGLSTAHTCTCQRVRPASTNARQRVVEDRFERRLPSASSSQCISSSRRDSVQNPEPSNFRCASWSSAARGRRSDSPTNTRPASLRPSRYGNSASSSTGIALSILHHARHIRRQNSHCETAQRRGLASSAHAQAKVSKSTRPPKPQGRKPTLSKAASADNGAGAAAKDSTLRSAKVFERPLRPGSVEYQQALQAVRQQKKEQEADGGVGKNGKWQGGFEEKLKEAFRSNFGKKSDGDDDVEDIDVSWIDRIVKKQKLKGRRIYDDWGGASEASPQLAKLRSDAARAEFLRERDKRVLENSKLVDRVVQDIEYEFPHIKAEFKRGDIKLDDFRHTGKLWEYAEEGPHLAKGSLYSEKGIDFTFARHWTSSFFMKYVRLIILIIAAVWLGVWRMWRKARASWQEQRDPRRLQWLLENMCCSMQNLRQGRWWTLVTAMFSHDTIGHLLGNFFLLNYCAASLIRYMGPGGWLGLYLTGGIVSTGATVLWNEYVDPVLARVLPWRDPSAPPAVRGLHGASGAIYAMATARYFHIPPRVLKAWPAPVGQLRLLTNRHLMLLVLAYDTFSPFFFFSHSNLESHTSHIIGALVGLVWLRLGIGSSVPWASRSPLPRFPG